MPTFEATCEKCGEGEQTENVAANGAFVCARCLTATPPKVLRKRHRTIDPTRRMGCTVTTELPDGSARVFTESGTAVDALMVITTRLDYGERIVSISTWRSVLGDLKGGGRKHSAANDRVDPYKVERTLLGKIGRLDLLTERANPLWAHPRHLRRAARIRGTVDADTFGDAA